MNKKNVNECKKHPGLLKKIVCERDKILLCHTCFDEGHSNHKQFMISTKLMNTYHFKAFLGKGSQGNVFSVQNLFDKKLFAVKLIENITDESSYEVAEKEIELLSQFKHPNIIRYKHAEYLEEEERIALYMELADFSLDAKIKNLSIETIEKYFKEICEGMKYLHDRKMIHRDIKPQNILIKDGTIKLSDFGIAKKTDTTMITITDKANVFGTYSYLPPEVLKGEKYSVKCDVWALGVIFYQMLNRGVNLFAAKKDKEEVKNKILNAIVEIEEKYKNTKYETILLGYNLLKY